MNPQTFEDEIIKEFNKLMIIKIKSKDEEIRQLELANTIYEYFENMMEEEMREQREEIKQLEEEQEQLKKQIEEQEELKKELEAEKGDLDKKK